MFSHIVFRFSPLFKSFPAFSNLFKSCRIRSKRLKGDGYSKSFFMQDNKERYPDATPEQLAQAWKRAFEKMASDF